MMLVGGGIRVERPVVDHEPVGVRGGRAVFEHVVEGPEAAARVVEDAVENNADVAGVGGVEELAQGVVAAEQGIDLVVVVRVVAVVGRGGKDGVQVEGRDAQVVQIVEIVDDAVEVAALKSLFLGGSAPWLEINLLLVRDLPAPGKAVGKDLVEDGVLCPVGGIHCVRRWGVKGWALRESRLAPAEGYASSVGRSRKSRRSDRTNWISSSFVVWAIPS
jgi:hypothetical protein